jgi:hypothetical protein
MGDYAAEYVQLAAPRSPSPSGTEFSPLGKLDGGVRYSVGDTDALVAAVLLPLQEAPRL